MAIHIDFRNDFILLKDSVEEEIKEMLKLKGSDRLILLFGS